MAQKANRVRNWRKYNQALVNRGSITFWVDDNSLKKWYQTNKTHTRGRPKKYSDLAIVCALCLKAFFKLTFRSVVGFLKSYLHSLKKLNIEVPDYTSICKRQKNLQVDLPISKIRSHKKIDIVVDSTGLKVFGEGEWKVRQHGYVKHRLWRKLHLAVNSDTQEIEAFELTNLGTQDSQGFAALINKIKKKLKSATGDGAYDRFSCYELAFKHNFEMITPPQRNAKASRERTCNRKKASPEATQKRDKAIDAVRELGRTEWKKSVGYHRRSLAETGMFRLKTLLNNRLSSRTMESQKTETAIYCRVINKITRLGFGT